VISLYGEQYENELMQGEVYVRFLENEQLADARLPLAPKDYEQACDAHKLGKYIHVNGLLARQKRRYVVTEYRSFEVLSLVTFGNDVQQRYLKRAQQNVKRRQKQHIS
jgi:hypothetical protein